MKSLLYIPKYLFAHQVFNFFWCSNFSSFIISFLFRVLPLTKKKFFRVGLLVINSLVSLNLSSPSGTKWWPNRTTSKYRCHPQSRVRTKRIFLLEEKGWGEKVLQVITVRRCGWEVWTEVGNALTFEVAINGSCDMTGNGIKHKESRVRSRGQRQNIYKSTYNCPFSWIIQRNFFSPTEYQATTTFFKF